MKKNVKKILMILGILPFMNGCREVVEDFGELIVHDVYSWVGDYPATEFNLIFTNPSKEEDVTYTYDEEFVFVDEVNHTVKGLKEGITTINVSSENFNTSFKVYIEDVDESDPKFSLYKNGNDWVSRYNGLLNNYRNSGTDGKTTIFIGDSFFDTAFWTNFYTESYYGKDALCMGIGSTTTYTWEVLAKEMLSQISPKNIVIHCGTNTIYDDLSNAKETTSSVQRMLTLIHEACPNSMIYYFTITNRTYVGASERQPIVDEVNQNSIDFGINKTWLKVVDTNPLIKWTMLKDGIHPSAEYYYIFVDALNDAGIEVLDKE